MIDKWKKKLGLTEWDIVPHNIISAQVVFPDDIHPKDKYFIGVYNKDRRSAIIYHDIDLYEEAVVHELLHLKYPDKDEAWVNNKTEELLKVDAVTGHLKYTNG